MHLECCHITNLTRGKMESPLMMAVHKHIELGDLFCAVADTQLYDEAGMKAGDRQY